MIIPAMNKWKFTLGCCEGAELPDFDDSAWRTLDLPHDWQIENNRDPDEERGGSQGFYPRNQVGWYRYHFEAPLEWQEQWVQICFDGVQRFSTVWLNGVKIGGRPYGYVPFELDLNQALRYGQENVIAVKVDNSIGGGDRWYSGAGIYRQVHLALSGKTYIPWNGVKVTTLNLNKDAARVRISVEIVNKAGKEAKAELKGRIVPPGPGSDPLEFNLPFTCAADNQIEVEHEIELKNPLRWDIDNPALYGLSFNLEGDTVPLRFGLREFRFDGEEGFFLNGRPLKLKGVNLHHDGGAVGAAVPVEIWRRRFKKLKELGANALRCSHNPQAAEFYDLADEMGFLLIDEIYDKWPPTEMYYKEFFDEWWERDLEAMIRRDRNHPSVILWSVGNEIEFQFQDHFYEQLGLMCNKVRSLDPDRPVSVALLSAPRDFTDRDPLEKRLDALLKYAGLVDVLMLNYMESFYRVLKKAGLKKAIIGSEVFTCYRMAEAQTTNRILQSPWIDLFENKFVAGSFLWAGIDYFGESFGWPSRGWSGAMLDTAGFEKIRTWYIASYWKEEPVLKLAVFDEQEPYDLARHHWSFPQMRRHWNYSVLSPLKHVAAITNCDLVKLYLNNDAVREALPDHERDGMAHFWLPFVPGLIRAEGWRKGVKVIEDILHTAKRAASVEIIAPLKASPGEVVPVELWLRDKYGEPWVLDNPLTKVMIRGDASLMAMDNGDMCSPEVYAVSERSFWNGHILALLRMGNSTGTVSISAAAAGMNPVSRDITVV